MERGNDKNKMVTKMRPDPDFNYLAKRSKEIMEVGIPLSRINRNPGEIPGFYADEHKD